MKKYILLFLLFPLLAFAGNTIEPGATPSGVVGSEQTILPSWLKTTNYPADGYCYTYDLSSGYGTWESCGGGGGGISIILDIGDDGGNDSTGITEIATTGDTYGVLSMPSQDKALFDMTKRWPLSQTANVANAGDSATAFFSSGLIEHERGGLEEDVSAYSGFVKITGGATSSVTAHAGTDITADLEEETHASEHGENAADEILAEALGTACTDAQIYQANASGGVICSNALDLKANLASPTFTGTVTLPDNTVIVTDNVTLSGGTLDGVAIGDTTPDTGIFTALTAIGATSLTSASFSDNTTLADDKCFRLGTDADYYICFNSSTEQIIFRTLLDGSTMTDTNPAWLFDFASGGTADDEQRLGGFSDNGVVKWYVDEDGDSYQAGEITAAGFNSSAADGYRRINVMNTNGELYAETAGDTHWDNTTKRWNTYDDSDFIIWGREDKDWSILSPTTSDNTMLFKAQDNIVITDIHCIVDPADTGDSITINIMECNGTGDSCATVDAAITCDNDGAEDDGSFSNGTIDAGDWVAVEFGTPSGTVDTLSWSVYFKRIR